DLCTAGNCGASLPAGTPGRLPDGADRGGLTTGLLNMIAPAKPTKAPFIIRTSAPNASGSGGETIIDPGTAYNFGVEASDPEGGNLSIVWATSAGGGSVGSPSNTGNIKSTVLYTSPATLLPTMTLTATVTSDKSGLSTVVTFNLKGSDPCIGKSAGDACSTGDKCVTAGTETCQNVSGTLQCKGTAVTCSGATQCADAVCNSNTGCGIQ